MHEINPGSYEAGIVSQDQMAELLNETDQLTAIFVAIINKSRLKA